MVVADEIGEDDTVADSARTATRCYAPLRESWATTTPRGWTTTGRACARRRAAAPTARSTPFCLSSSRRRSSSIDSSTPKKTAGTWKFAGVGVECLATVLVLNMLVHFSFDCLMQLPTGARFFVPASDDTEAIYAYADDDPVDVAVLGVAFNVAASFIFTIVSELCCAHPSRRPLADADVELGDEGGQRSSASSCPTPGPSPRTSGVSSVDGGCFADFQVVIELLLDGAAAWSVLRKCPRQTSTPSTRRVYRHPFLVVGQLREE